MAGVGTSEAASRMRNHLIFTGSGLAVSFAMTAVGWHMIYQTTLFNGKESHKGGDYWQDAFTWYAFGGFILVLAFLPAIFLFGGSFALAVYKYDSHIPAKEARLAILTGLLALSVYGTFACYHGRFGQAYELFDCAVFGCYRPNPVEKYTASKPFKHNLPTAFGMATFIPTVAMDFYLIILLLLTAVQRTTPQLKSGSRRRHLSSHMDRHSDRAVQKASADLEESLLEAAADDDDDHHHHHGGHVHTHVHSVKPARHPSKCVVLVRCLAALVFFFLLLVATSYLPQNWEPITRFQLQEYLSKKVKGVEVEDALFTTKNLVLESEKVILHIFPDCVIYYSFILFVIAFGGAARIIPAFGKLLSHRIMILTDRQPMKWWWTWVLPPPWSITVGAVVLLTALFINFILFVQYWAHDHNFHRGEHMSNSQVAARTLGQITNYFMGLMLFPVTKNSILTSCFGIAWEQVIFVHVYMGHLVLLTICLHMLCWWHVFDQQAAFPQDVLQIPMWFPANSPCEQNANNRDCFVDFHQHTTPNSDNFTIQLATVTTFSLFICTGFFARYSMRRMDYDRFYYFHHIFMVVFIVALLHAASSWYYLIGGLSLWFVDRCMRQLNRVRKWRLHQLEVHPQSLTTSLQLVPLHSITKEPTDFTFSCGQYLYLNVPAISTHEWHPFTISSAPSDNKVCCNIKAAPGPIDASFTGKLLRLGERLGDKTHDLIVNVDGPYGEFLDPSQYDELLLIAGGIGVTPIHSIFREARSMMMHHKASCRRVHWVWVVFDRAVLDPFLDTLHEVLRDDLGGALQITIYVDGEKGLVEPLDGSPLVYRGVPIRVGRLSPIPFIDELDPTVRSHVFVCGPPGLAATADEACLKKDISFHKEVFAF